MVTEAALLARPFGFKVLSYLQNDLGKKVEEKMGRERKGHLAIIIELTNIVLESGQKRARYAGLYRRLCDERDGW